MKKRLARFLVMAMLIPLLLLHGCFWRDSDIQNEQPGAIAGYEEDDTTLPEVTRRRPRRFSLRYDSTSTLNPITADNRDNIILSSLLYESLFVLNEAFEAEPVLAESYHTYDGRTYTITIMPGVIMSDGTYLTADDVEYSIRLAMQRGRFVNRLRIIENVSATEELTVTITLRFTNNRFIRLLDVPIIKSGSSGRRIPFGTGPFIYMFRDAGVRLESFMGHRDFGRLPIHEIHLVECYDNEVSGLFSDGVLSLIWDGPTSATAVRLNRTPATRLYDTTTLHFIGFNARNPALRIADVRRAVGLAVDRAYIVNELYREQAVMAPLALSPLLELYDATWERMNVRELEQLFEFLFADVRRDGDAGAIARFESMRGEERRLNEEGISFMQDPFIKAAALISRARFMYIDGDAELTLDFIVSRENPYRVRAAHKIAQTLRFAGFGVTVRELPWAEFIRALQNGNFDIYYGAASLGADFDFSPLLLPGGRLDYGGVGSEEYREYINAFLSAEAGAEESAAARSLVNMIRREAPFIPILYKRHAVYTQVGAVSGASPSQSNIFRNLTDWTVDFSRLQ